MASKVLSKRKYPTIVSKDKEVLVTVTSQKNSCAISLWIPNKEIADHGKLLASADHRFKLELYFRCKSEKTEYREEIHLNFTHCYPKDELGILTSRDTCFTIQFDSGDFFGKLVLYPNAYLPSSRIGQIRKGRKKKKDRLFTYLTADTKPSQSKYTPYKASNITKPYQGGRVSPK